MPKHGVHDSWYERMATTVSTKGVGAPRSAKTVTFEDGTTSQAYSRRQLAELNSRWLGAARPGRIARRVKRAIDKTTESYKNARRTLRKLRRAGLRVYHISDVGH